MARILVVEDDEILRNGIAFALTREGYQVKTAGSLSGMRGQLEGAPDLVILDVSLPDGDSRDFLPCLRKESQVPVIFLTARNTEKDMIAGFDAGADDYITKPFVMAEVLARIKANLRRTNQYAAGSSRKQEEPATLSCGDIQLNPADFTVRKRGKKIDLTAKEFEILRLLMQNPKKVYTKEQIYSLVWEDAYLGDENAVNVHISRLRNKIEDDARNPEYIITVWGFGYRIGG